MKQFIIAIDKIYVADSQYVNLLEHPELALEDDVTSSNDIDWDEAHRLGRGMLDIEYDCIIGIYSGESEQEVIALVAKQEAFDSRQLKAFELAVQK